MRGLSGDGREKSSLVINMLRPERSSETTFPRGANFQQANFLTRLKVRPKGDAASLAAQRVDRVDPGGTASR